MKPFKSNSGRELPATEETSVDPITPGLPRCCSYITIPIIQGSKEGDFSTSRHYGCDAANGAKGYDPDTNLVTERGPESNLLIFLPNSKSVVFIVASVRVALWL